jgi:hypothetical protein
MTLPELVADLERRAFLAEAEGATAPVGNVYRLVLAELAAVQSNGSGAAPKLASTGNPDRLLTPAAVAQRLGVSLRFVYAHRDQLGGRALSRRALRFPEAGIARYLARRP